MLRKKKVLTIFLPLFISTILGLLLITSACEQRIPPGASKAELQLNWIHDPTFTGEYIAAKKGFWYPAENLKIEIKTGGVGIDPLARVISKKSDFAVVGADKALIAISNGNPIKIIAVDLQRNPVGWIARQELKVNSFKDLVGRRDIELGDKVGTETTNILQLALTRLNLASKLTPKGVPFDFTYFLGNPKSVYPVYLNEEPIRAKLANIPISEIDPSKQENGGVKLYGNVIITHQDTVEKTPKKVKGFVAGLRKGWEYADDPQHNDETVKILTDFMPEQEREYLLEVMKRSVDYATNMYGRKVPPTHMEISAWEETLNTLMDSGILKKPFDLNRVILIS